MYQRIVKKNIEKRLFKGKVIILYGPRQVGKTTLVKQILEEFNGEKLYIPCDVPSRKALVSSMEPSVLKRNFGNAKLVVLDEAQLVENIGVTLKVFVDAYPDVQVIATGSSSFDLANKIREPLTGRAYEYMLYTLSYEEVISNRIEKHDQEEFRMRFGWYPGMPENTSEAEYYLEILQQNTFYKDIFALEQIKKPKVLQDILVQLAYSIGTVIKLENIAREVKTTSKTVERYLDILEKMFVICRIYPYSKNPANERKKGCKVYFTDVGLRNSLIKDHKELSIRNDKGALFENYFIIERIKYNSNHEIFNNIYFWQNYRQQEVDYIEIKEGDIDAYECKYAEKSLKSLDIFKDEYSPARTHVVTLDVYDEYIKNRE